MSDQVTHNVEEIERLLATRQELIGWLGRLDSAGARTPESVRAKVRADYRARLAHVVDRLRTHTDLVETTLGGLLTQSREVRQVRQQELEILAEAELRHAVGELSDGQWQVIELESSGKIAGFDVELDRLGGEIHRPAGGPGRDPRFRNDHPRGPPRPVRSDGAADALPGPGRARGSGARRPETRGAAVRSPEWCASGPRQGTDPGDPVHAGGRRRRPPRPA